jgi:hypothetical protein
MHPGDESGPPVEVRVNDRRRFTETGEARDEAEASASLSATPGAAVMRTAEPGAEASSAPAGTPREVLELGVEAVFFIFYQSALIALGAPEMHEEPRPPDLAEARQSIEFLRVLEAKTAGNLTAEEAATLRQLLDDAQLRFVHAARGASGGKA